MGQVAKSRGIAFQTVNLTKLYCKLSRLRCKISVLLPLYINKQTNKAKKLIFCVSFYCIEFDLFPMRLPTWSLMSATSKSSYCCAQPFFALRASSTPRPLTLLLQFFVLAGNKIASAALWRELWRGARARHIDNTRSFDCSRHEKDAVPKTPRRAETMRTMKQARRKKKAKVGAAFRSSSSSAAAAAIEMAPRSLPPSRRLVRELRAHVSRHVLRRHLQRKLERVGCSTS